MEIYSDIFQAFGSQKPALFLDYDGTLTPIVSRPEEAILSNDMRALLKELSGLITIAIVTGRDKEDVEILVGIDQLIYAGSHGYIISGPNGLWMQHPDSSKIIEELDLIEKEVSALLQEKTVGAMTDRKLYAIGMHFRNARPRDEATVYEIANNMIKKYPGFKLGEGKKIVEIKPNLDWHKGKAMLWIMDALGYSQREDIIPIFIGDDITDEDAFGVLVDKGAGILVGDHGRETSARFHLRDVDQVKDFFIALIDKYKKKKT
jgi:trehalose 6-phosphate phosphatase